MEPLEVSKTGKNDVKAADLLLLWSDSSQFNGV